MASRSETGTRAETGAREDRDGYKIISSFIKTET